MAKRAVCPKLPAKFLPYWNGVHRALLLCSTHQITTMITLGNIALILASLLYFALFSALYAKEPPRGGDAAMGYVWGVIFICLAMSVSLAIAVFSVWMKGGFEWVHRDGAVRLLLVVVSFLAIIIITALASLFKNESGDVPALLRALSAWVPAVVPLVVIIGLAVLLRPDWRAALPPAYYQWPLMLCALTGALGILAGLYAWAAQSVSNTTARKEAAVQQYDENQQRMLREIDSCDVSKNLVFILVFTDANQTPQVREKAVEKVKTHPKWQQELIRLLQNDWAPEAFNFLASNEVEDTALFPKAVEAGLYRQADLIRQSIRRAAHSSHFYEDQFTWEVERALRTATRFKGMGVDFLPAVRDIRAALDEPSSLKDVEFRCVKIVERWIEER